MKTRYFLKHLIYFILTLFLLIGYVIAPDFFSEKRVFLCLLLLILVDQLIILLLLPTDEVSKVAPLFVVRKMGSGIGLNPDNLYARILLFLVCFVTISLIIILL